MNNAIASENPATINRGELTDEEFIALLEETGLASGNVWTYYNSNSLTLISGGRTETSMPYNPYALPSSIDASESGFFRAQLSSIANIEGLAKEVGIVGMRSVVSTFLTEIARGFPGGVNRVNNQILREYFEAEIFAGSIFPLKDERFTSRIESLVSESFTRGGFDVRSNSEKIKKLTAIFLKFLEMGSEYPYVNVPYSLEVKCRKLHDLQDYINGVANIGGELNVIAKPVLEDNNEAPAERRVNPHVVEGKLGHGLPFGRIYLKKLVGGEEMRLIIGQLAEGVPSFSMIALIEFLGYEGTLEFVAEMIESTMREWEGQYHGGVNSETSIYYIIERLHLMLEADNATRNMYNATRKDDRKLKLLVDKDGNEITETTEDILDWDIWHLLIKTAEIHGLLDEVEARNHLDFLGVSRIPVVNRISAITNLIATLLMAAKNKADQSESFRGDMAEGLQVLFLTTRDTLVNHKGQHPDASIKYNESMEIVGDENDATSPESPAPLEQTVMAGADETLPPEAPLTNLQWIREGDSKDNEELPSENAEAARLAAAIAALEESITRGNITKDKIEELRAELQNILDQMVAARKNGKPLDFEEVSGETQAEIVELITRIATLEVLVDKAREPLIAVLENKAQVTSEASNGEPATAAPGSENPTLEDNDEDNGPPASQYPALSDAELAVLIAQWRAGDFDKDKGDSPTPPQPIAVIVDGDSKHVPESGHAGYPPVGAGTLAILEPNNPGQYFSEVTPPSLERTGTTKAPHLAVLVGSAGILVSILLGLVRGDDMKHVAVKSTKPTTPTGQVVNPPVIPVTPTTPPTVDVTKQQWFINAEAKGTGGDTLLAVWNASHGNNQYSNVSELYAQQPVWVIQVLSNPAYVRDVVNQSVQRANNELAHPAAGDSSQEVLRQVYNAVSALQDQKYGVWDGKTFTFTPKFYTALQTNPSSVLPDLYDIIALGNLIPSQAQNPALHNNMVSDMLAAQLRQVVRDATSQLSVLAKTLESRSTNAYPPRAANRHIRNLRNAQGLVSARR